MKNSNLREIISKQQWIFAKTYAKTAPHEYIVRDNLSKKNKKLFDELALFIQKNGYKKYFYDQSFIYCDIKNKKYWHMGNIINRDDQGKEYKI